MGSWDWAESKHEAMGATDGILPFMLMMRNRIMMLGAFNFPIISYITFCMLMLFKAGIFNAKSGKILEVGEGRRREEEKFLEILFLFFKWASLMMMMMMMMMMSRSWVGVGGYCQSWRVSALLATHHAHSPGMLMIKMLVFCGW